MTMRNLAKGLVAGSVGTELLNVASSLDWLSDLIPHIAYGAGVVAIYEALDRA